MYFYSGGCGIFMVHYKNNKYLAVTDDYGNLVKVSYNPVVYY